MFVLFFLNYLWCSHGSVLEPLLSLNAILRYRKIGYHINADDTQLCILFKCKQLLEAIYKLNSCFAVIRRWMSTNKYNINHLKIKFIMSRSQRLKFDLSGLSVNVGESQITQL